MKKQIKHKVFAILTAFLMVFVMMPMVTEPVLADDDIPEYTVTLDPGAIGGQPITVKSTDDDMLVHYPVNPAEGQFQLDNGEIWYRYPNLPSSFAAPNGVDFLGWLSPDYDIRFRPGEFYRFADNTSITFTAQWEATISFNSNGGSGEMNSAKVQPGESYTIPECGFTAPDGKVFYGWNTVAKGTSDNWGTWYYPGETPTLSEGFTLYARWGDPRLSLCSYDITNSKSLQGGKFILDDGSGQYGGGWSPGCNNYVFPIYTYCIVTAAPDNGYRFEGWYEGKYIGKDEQGNPIQDAVPYMNQWVNDDRTHDFLVESNLVLCPVFEEAPLVNFVDIGNIWTKLDSLNSTPFTGEINPNEEGLSDFIALTKETWTSTDGSDVLTSEDPTRIPIVGKTYKYEATITAKGDNTFDSDNGFRFIYGGKEFAYEDLEVTFSADNKTATISGFIPDQTVGAVDLKDAEITGLVSKTYNGKAQTQNPAVKLDVNGTMFSLENGIDYDVEYSNNVNAGTATVTITGKGIYTGTASATFKINKAANPLKVGAKTASIKYKVLKKKSQSLKAAKVIKFTKAGQGAVSCVKSKGNKKISINKKTGKVTIKKGLKKGTYKVTVKVQAAGNGNYNKSAVKKITFKIKVK